MEDSSTRRASACVVRVALFLCAALASGLLAAGAAPPATLAAGGAGVGPTRADVASAVAFRNKLGLRADRSFVASTFGNSAFSAAKWGVPLDSAEAADLARRVQIQKDAAGALAAWSAEPASGGAFIDQRARGSPVFLTIGDPAVAKARLGKLLPVGANGRFVRVRHSMAELLEIQDRVNADRRAGVLASLGLQSTSIDARGNVVVVGVAADTDAVRSELVARYGDAVEARLELPAQGGDAGGCTARDSCPPAKGGIEIVSGYNGNDCTIGFLVRVQGSPDPRILTAGHCIAKSGGTGTSRTWSHDGSSVGWAELGYWTDGADADVGLISPATSTVSGARNLLYGSSSNNIVPVTSFRPTTEQIQGGLVCRSGAVSGYHCGTIELTNRTKDVDGHTIDHQWVVDFDACPGDSGGPYFLGGVAYGIHTDSTVGCDPATNQAWYSPMGWVLDVLQARGHPVALCVTSTCDAEVGTWTARGSLDQASWNAHLIKLDDGRVLQVGGESGALLAGGGGSGSGTPVVFDPSTGQWSDTAAPPWSPATCDGQFAVRLADGSVLVGGGRHTGSGADDACAGAFIYDPGVGPAGSWTAVASPPAVLESAGAVLLADRRAFVTGGSGSAGSQSVAMAYSPADDAWTSLAPAPAGALAPLVLALGDGRVLVSGGYVIADPVAPGFTDVTATFLYTPGTNSWASTTAVGARGVAGAVLEDGRIVIGGGQHLTWNGAQGSSFANAISRFDPEAGTWTALSPMSTGRAGFTLTELPSGLLLAAGGRVAGATAAGLPTKAVEGWDPASKAWYPGPGMQVSRGDHDAALLDDGSLLVAGGGTASTETYVAGDFLPPTATAPATALRSAVTMSTGNIPVRVSWTAADAGGSGVGTYDLARSTDGGAFSTIATRLTSTSYDLTTVRGHTYRFEARARDWAGNLGPWKAASTIRVNALQESSTSIRYSGTWKHAAYASYSGGSLRAATASGASASYTFTGRSVAFVSSRGPTRGSAKVYIDGVLAATVNLNAATLTYRYVAYQKTWTTAGKHTLKIVVLGTSGHPRVDLDVIESITAP